MANKGVLEGLIDAFARLPGVGRKNAQRIAYAIMRMEPERAEKLGQLVIDSRKNARLCARCNNAAAAELCHICANPRRDTSRIMVVEDPGTLYQVEHTGSFNGLYHVLSGTLSPLDGIGPDAVKLDGLLARLKDGEVKEVILATSPTVEGEATALYITREIRPLGVEATRIAYGVPVGMDLEYADEVSLIKAIEGRRAV